MNLRKQLQLLDELGAIASRIDKEQKAMRRIARALAEEWDRSDPHGNGTKAAQPPSDSPGQMRLDGDLPGAGPAAP